MMQTFWLHGRTDGPDLPTDFIRPIADDVVA